MPGTSAGTGQPITFRCSKCRKRGEGRGGRKNDVVLTGRKKEPATRNSDRVSRHLREYKCNHCGHVGWSNHKDLEHLEEFLKKGKTP